MMKVKVDPFYLEDLLDQEAIFLETSSGPLPYFIQSIEAIAEDMALLQLEDVDTKEKASALARTALMVPADGVEIVDAEEWNDIVGYFLVDKNMGLIGKIDQLVEMPQQILAELHYQGKEILVPMHDDLILEVDDLEKKIIMELPEGYFDIFLE